MPKTQNTISYIATPTDARCKWWSVFIQKTFELGSLDDKTSTKALGYLRRGADLELEDGDAVLDSEARHHRKQRGFDVMIGIAINGALEWFEPGAEMKAKIKAWANPDQWKTLRKGSGNVAACLRLLAAHRMGFDPVAAESAVAWKLNDPTEPARWIEDESEAEEIEAQDAGLIVRF